MAIAGALIGGAIGAFGEKPKIPKLQPLDVTAEQAAAVAGNIGNLPEITRLGAAVNLFTGQELVRMRELLAPGYGAMQNKEAALIMSLLQGQIPGDVESIVRRRTAETSLAGGFGGSGAAENLTARDLGLTSLAITQSGLNSANQWLARVSATTPSFDVTSMFVSPQQRWQMDFAERQAQYERNLLAAQVKAAPDPATAALGREVDRFFNTLAQSGMMMAGMGMSSGMGSGGGGMSGGGALYGTGNPAIEQMWQNYWQQSSSGSAMGKGF